MSHTYTVIEKKSDATSGNIIVRVQFVDSDDPGNPHIAETFANDLTDTTIDDWARRVIETLDRRKAAFNQITTGVAKSPADLSDERKALEAAQVVFTDALEQAQIAALKDEALSAAYTALRAARAALQAAEEGK